MIEPLLMMLVLTIAFAFGYFLALHHVSNRISDLLVGANNMLKMPGFSKESCLLFMGRLHKSLNGISRYQPSNASRQMIEYLASDEIRGEEEEDELEIVST